LVFPTTLFYMQKYLFRLSGKANIETFYINNQKLRLNNSKIPFPYMSFFIPIY